MSNQTIPLKAKTRTTLGKKIKHLSRQGLLPGVIYGFRVDNTPLEINAKDFRKAYEQAGSTTLVDLTIDEKTPVKVLIQDVNLTPVWDRFAHVDFFAVDLTEKIKAMIPVELVGESPAAIDLGANIITNKHEIEVEALPTDLIHSVEVDISGLKSFDDIIHVKDLKLPVTLTVLDDPEEVVILVTEPRSEEELAEELADTGEKEEEAIKELGAEPITEGTEAQSTSPETETKE